MKDPAVASSQTSSPAAPALAHSGPGPLRGQVHSHLRTFTLTVPSSSDVVIADSRLLFRTQVKCHLFQDASPGHTL